MKIIHLTVVRQLTAGQAKQLASEIEASSDLQEVEWTTVALQSAPATHPFVRQIPRPFRSMFLRNFFGWLTALNLSRDCDYLLMRHITFDPFSFIFAPLIRNRVTVHHAKEIEELRMIAPGWRGRVASDLERLSGRVAVRNAAMIAGVTHEIAEYERSLHDPRKRICVYANGVIPSSIALLEDHRATDEIHAAFLCGTFSDWHGLDKLVAAVDECDELKLVTKLKIHLIGRLSDKQKIEISATTARLSVFVAHGPLGEEDYRTILDRCHIGLGSLALERKNLREAATLKVRELLAMGLPIYSAHHDTSLPANFEFYNYDHKPTIRSIVDYANKCSGVSRKCVAAMSAKYISKTESMRTVLRAVS